MADMAKRDKEEQGIGTQLPGTGGDYIDTADVEGHKLRRDEESALRRDEVSALRRDEESALRRDGETGLYNPGPSTQGEIMRRGPGDNPHGDR
jgi:hypothetical protein